MSGAHIFQSLTVCADEAVAHQGHVQHSQRGPGGVICRKPQGYKVLQLEKMRRYYLPERC
jgi:hypothetical protein